MPQPNYMILYVDSPEASGRFYRALLRCEPVEESPTFVLFALPSGLMLGLWSRHTVVPAATMAGGDGEVAFSVEDDSIVDATFADWKERGLSILQDPTAMDFGRTFVAADPDGHRLRVFAAAR
ncbi:MAG TPA: VOC family protein [Telmatospirillum sp.]|nr:VOC family protein [Telmatospirillum sp.]